MPQPSKQNIINTAITCAIYCRYSSKSQDTGYSIEAQRSACIDYANKQGWKVHNIYIDKALSGTSDDRDSFQKIISDTLSSDKPPYSIVLVHKLDRFARNRYDSIRYKHILKKRGVRVMSVTQPIIGSGDPTEVLLESLLEGMDEFYSLNLARESIKGMVQNAKQGFWNGGAAPYGYKLKRFVRNGRDKSTLEIDPIESKIVKHIFELYMQGNIGIKGVAMSLNNKGLKPRYGKYWNKTAIERILSNEKYIGNIIFGKHQNRKGSSYLPEFPLQVIKSCHPAIVDRELFDKVQQILKKRSPAASSPRSHNDSFLLSSLITCKKCGSRYVGTSAKSGQYFYYICGTKDRKGRNACNSNIIKREAIEQAVIKGIREKFVTKKNLKSLVGDLTSFIEDFKKSTSRDLQIINRDIEDKERRLTKLYDAIEKGSSGLTADDLAPRMRQLKADIEALKSQALQLEFRKKEYSAISIGNNKDKVINRYVGFLSKVFNDKAFVYNKQMIRDIIDRIEYGDGHIDIYWRIPDPSIFPTKTPVKEASSGKGYFGSPARTRT